VASWMVGKGAKHIVLLSRSGKLNGKSKDQVDALNQSGANIVVQRCNVADRADVERLLTKGVEDLPPVRGVIHGAMVLRVSSSPLQKVMLGEANIKTGCSLREDDVRSIRLCNCVQGARSQEFPRRPLLNTP
jgi:NAD(P)-dependent dehydrogenase (short-subunit alcohol dehydrogenase family)